VSTAAVPEPLATIFVALFALAIGSFLNVVIHRLPMGESLVAPRSRCPGCGAPIAAWQNVPVLSWLLLRGRCASCRKPISLRYPLVELATALLAVALWRGFGPGAAFVVAAPFALAMLVLFFTDWDHQLLPDPITLGGFATGLVLAWWNPFLHGATGWGRLWSALSGAALGAGVLWGIGAAYTRLRGIEAMGMGDVKMMAMVGAFAGPAGVLFTLFFASIVGALVGIALVPLRGRTMKDTLPFGCFLAPAALAALLWGRRALDAYLSLVRPPV
jgi:leader peptidase (prepilin peptidase)/N-methyltransferase